MNIKRAIELLQLKKFRKAEDLKNSFHQQARRLHPDLNPDRDTTILFREIVEAYEYALKHLSELFKHFGVPESPEEEETVRAVVENLDDIFEDIFGFTKQGRVLGYQEPEVLYLPLEDFVFGATKRLKTTAYAECPHCQGNGAQKGSLARICSYCFGKGVIYYHGDKQQREVCPKCKGRGRKIQRPCERCDGFGRLKTRHLQEFKLPLAMQPFQVYSLESYDLQTNSVTGLFIEPRLLRHPIFQIDHYDLLCEYHADFDQLDETLHLFLSTPLGKVPLVISSKAKKGDVIRITGAGLYKDSQKKERGDLVVALKNKKKSLAQKIFGGLFEKQS